LKKLFKNIYFILERFLKKMISLNHWILNTLHFQVISI